ncbi:MAG: flagellar hook assembly protein FlgD [Kangiellaceae bacterium]|nr:flagellar hook assembly protein FlgD [Kangiellaceae bacterium]
MTIISNPTDNIYTDIGINPPPTEDTSASQELGQSDFLMLLTTQLANQDPLSPTDSKEFISQMTQFSSVDSLQTLVTKFDDLSTSLTSNQALQASSLVGRQVLIPSAVGYVPNDTGMSGQINVPSATNNLRFEIRDAAGQLVRRIDVGDRDAGDIEFYWDGNNEEGEFVGEGQYEVAAFGNVNGKTEQLPTSIRAQVQSVNLGGSDGGIFLNLTGLGQINFNDVKAVG